jgi:hypothetical protein
MGMSDSFDASIPDEYVLKRIVEKLLYELWRDNKINKATVERIIAAGKTVRK